MNIPEILALPLAKLEEILEIKRRLIALEGGDLSPVPAAPAPTKTKAARGGKTKAPVKKPMSDDVREKIRDAAKKRWAERKAAEKKK